MDVKVKVYKQVYSEMFRGDNLNCFLQSLPNDYFNGKLKAVCLSRDCVFRLGEAEKMPFVGFALFC